MKLESVKNEVVLSNVNCAADFKIKATAKSFRILSSGLYSNKIKAIIRELSCNAVDSHMAAKNVDTPFEVHLPSMLEPWFSIRDFGTGLDYDDVVTVYTTYFESTKTESNDYIGALGLGSKSPFSYTDNFSITTIKDGIQNIFSAYINESGVPAVVHMSANDTSESSGVEVKFSVTEESDYRRFRDEASEVYSWFTLKPNVIGTYYPSDRRYARKDIIPGVHLTGRHSVAVMGNIAYPLSGMSASKAALGSLADMLQCGLEMHFDIGELDFAASREELSYIPSTISVIIEKLQKLSDFILTDIEKVANSIDNAWTKAIYLAEQKDQALFRSAVDTYITTTGFTLCSTQYYNPLHKYSVDIGEAIKNNVRIQGFRINHTSTSRLGHKKYHDSTDDSYKTIMEIGISKNIMFVLNDMKVGALSRIQHHFCKSPREYQLVYLITVPGCTDADAQSKYAEFLKSIDNPPNVIKVSELSHKVAEKREKPDKVMKLTTWHNRGTFRTRWDACGEDILDDTNIHVYVPLTSRSPLRYENDGELHPFNDINTIVELCQGSNIIELKNMTVIGVRKSALLDVKYKPNWVLLEDYITSQLHNLSDKFIMNIVASGFFDTSSVSHYNNVSVLSKIKRDSPYKEFADVRASGVKCNTNEHNNTLSLCKKYHKGLDVAEIKKQLTIKYDNVRKIYPMLGHVHSWVPADEIATYVNLVDSLSQKE